MLFLALRRWLFLDREFHMGLCTALKQASPAFHFRWGKTRWKGDLAFVNSTPPPIPSFYSETFKEECGLTIKRHNIRLSQEKSSIVFKVNLGNLRPYLRKKKRKKANKQNKIGSQEHGSLSKSSCPASPTSVQIPRIQCQKHASVILAPCGEMGDGDRNKVLALTDQLF